MIQTSAPIILHENNIFLCPMHTETHKQKPTNKSRETSNPCIAQNPKKKKNSLPNHSYIRKQLLRLPCENF